MTLLEKFDTKFLQIIIGILAGIVVIYRITFLMIPMILKGYRTNDYAIMMKSISLIV
jgi:hypothetical protein